MTTVMNRFPILWTADGIVHGAPLAETRLEADPLLTGDPHAIVLRWRDRWRLAVGDAWPRAEILWEHGTLPLDPRRGLFEARPEVYGERIAALVAHLDLYAPGKVWVRGWIDIEEVPWERVKDLPALPGEEPVVGDGAFRSAQRPVEEVATAARDVPTSLEGLLDWLTSSPSQPFRDHPRRVRIGGGYVYVERRDRTVHRVPLAALRLRRGGGVYEDAVYVFGRCTALVLPTRSLPCPVRAALDARLEQLRKEAV